MRRVLKQEASMLPLFAAAGVGGAVMYMLDPHYGRRRRGSVLQKGTRALHGAEGMVRATGKDAINRAKGLAASAYRHRPDTDEIVTARVRAALGRVCSHAHAIHVQSRAGAIELHGPVLAREHGRIMRAIKKVRGVHDIHDHLTLHGTVAREPGLQGAGQRGPRFELLQDHWAPTARAFMGGLGLALCGLAASNRGALRIASGGLGAAVLARTIFNRPLKRIAGLGAGEEIVLQKTMHVNAPPGEVFEFFSRMEQFPRFMTHVREVRQVGPARYHWRVEGPGGTRFSWDARVTAWEPGRLLAWESIGSPLVENAGHVSFEPEGDGTRLLVRLHYCPPGGALGHAFATLLGRNPGQEMHDDLLRLKSLLERGKARGLGPQVRKEDILRTEH